MAPSPPWSDLPPELLTTITNHLSSNPLHLLRFRSVCKSFFHSLSSSSPPNNNILSPHFPLRTPEPSPSLSSSHFYSHGLSFLSLTIIYALHDPTTTTTPNSNTWIGFFDELNSGKLSIRIPLTKWDHHLPLDFPRNLNLLDFNASELGRYYNLSYAHRNGSGRFIKPRIWSEEVLKVVFLSSSNGLGLGLVVLFEEGKLGFLKLGSEGEWEVVHDGKGFRFDDIVEYKGRVLGIDRRARVYEILYELESSKLNIIVGPITGGGGRRKRLVESVGLLYSVVRCRRDSCRTGIFKVYVLNEKIRKWVEVNSIGEDRVFLFGLDFSLSVSAKVLEGCCSKNCILFNELSFRLYEGGRYGEGESLLFYKSRFGALRVGVYHLGEDGGHFEPIEAYPAYSSMFWPPPAWLQPNEELKLLGTFDTTVGRLLSRIRDEDLKVKFKELAPLARAFVLANGTTREDRHNILKQSVTVHQLLNELVMEIEKEEESVMKDIAKDAAKPHSLSTILQKQEGTSSAQPDEKTWMSTELKRRLDTHIKLQQSLKHTISFFEENMDELKNIVKFWQQVCDAGEEKRIMQLMYAPKATRCLFFFWGFAM